MKKMTPAQKNKKIQDIKDALYKACVTCMEEHEDEISDGDDLESKLHDYSTNFTNAVNQFFTFYEDTEGVSSKPIKAFKLSGKDFKKVQQEVEDSCLSDEGKEAILKAMGVD